MFVHHHPIIKMYLPIFSDVFSNRVISKQASFPLTTGPESMQLIDNVKGWCRGCNCNVMLYVAVIVNMVTSYLT